MYNFQPTALIYSSHNRCETIHRWWIAETALKSHDNKTILYIPHSMGRHDQQEYSWGTFRWYFNRFEDWGLKVDNFYYNDNLDQKDVEEFFHKLLNHEVVILGGGNSNVGMERFQALGARYMGNPDLFNAIMHQRQQNGKLTVGFSAGADQLCQYLSSTLEYGEGDPYAFGLARNVMTTLHHDWGRDEQLLGLSRKVPECLTFGLPNDAGIAVEQGVLPSGNYYQVIEFIVDDTWDLESDHFHIKTRQGMKVEHMYGDGRKHNFDNNDRVVRIMHPDNHYQYNWIVKNGAIYDYMTHEWSGYHSIEDILRSH